MKEWRAKAEGGNGDLWRVSARGTDMARTASRKTRCRPAPGTSAARRPAIPGDADLLVNISCVASVAARPDNVFGVDECVAAAAELGSASARKAKRSSAAARSAEGPCSGEVLVKEGRTLASGTHKHLTDTARAEAATNGRAGQ